MPSGTSGNDGSLEAEAGFLNLARNSVKFIDKGFVRLRAEVIEDEVHMIIEDSGPGIPMAKREMLFSIFQESLDSLSQGTVRMPAYIVFVETLFCFSYSNFLPILPQGVGLFLCKNLVELMDGDIRLDEDYDSGIKGYPGTRFVVNLKQPPIDPQFIIDYHPHYGADWRTGDTSPTHSDAEDDSVPRDLPEAILVLFVDDDPILRKLFTRTVRTVAPSWTVREAANRKPHY
jgi:hypothetical protein